MSNLPEKFSDWTYLLAMPRMYLEVTSRTTIGTENFRPGYIGGIIIPAQKKTFALTLVALQMKSFNLTSYGWLQTMESTNPFPIDYRLKISSFQKFLLQITCIRTAGPSELVNQQSFFEALSLLIEKSVTVQGIDILPNVALLALVRSDDKWSSLVANIAKWATQN